MSKPDIIAEIVRLDREDLSRLRSMELQIIQLLAHELPCGDDKTAVELVEKLFKLWKASRAELDAAWATVGGRGRINPDQDLSDAIREWENLK